MKKTAILVAVVIILGLGGFFAFSRLGGETPESGSLPAGGGLEVRPGLLGWLKGGKSVECVLATPEGEITMRVKGENVRIDGIPFGGTEEDAPAPGTSLTAGGWVYTWSGREGMKFSLNEIKDMSAEETEQVEERGQVSWEEWAEDQAANNVDYQCREASFPDDIFSPPANVAFVDWTEFVNKASELSESLPAGGAGGEMIDPAELEKLLEGLRPEGLLEEENEPTE